MSSRTYVSALERGLKSPTLPKVDALPGVLGLHPLTPLALSYGSSLADIENVLARVGSEAKEIFSTVTWECGVVDSKSAHLRRPFY